MEIKDAQQVSLVSALADATGKHPALAIAQPESQAPAGEASAPPPTGQNLLRTRQAIAEQLSRYLQSTTRNLEFLVDSASGQPVIVVRDGDGNVVRRIPGEEALQMMRRLNAQSGTFVDSLA
jgi:uncharacterized FlaG/YvyC family protein